MNQPPKSRPPTRRVSNRTSLDAPPHATRQNAPPRYVQPRRDPFRLVMGALIGASLVGILILALLLVSITTRPGGSTSSALPSSNLPGAPTQTGSDNLPTQGPGTVVPEEGKDHVDDGTTITYKSYPPSSGTHYGSTADYGFWEEEKPEGQLVHNLEHGAIVLYYKPGLSPDIVQSLRDSYVSLPPAKYGKVKLVVTPYSKLQSPLVIAAWGRVQPLSEFDYEAIQAFYQAWVDKGPEDVP